MSNSATYGGCFGPKWVVFWPKMKYVLAQNGMCFGPKRKPAVALLLFITLTFMPATLLAQTGRYSVDFSISPTDFVDSIAIEWTGEQVLVPVSIGGQSYRFLLDTGAGQTVVYADTPLAGAPSAGTIKARDAVGRTDTVRMVRLPQMRIGNTTLTGCQATVQRRAVRRTGIDGILGFDIVNRGLSMKIDVRNRLMVLTDRRRFFDSEPANVMRYRLDYHVPYVDVSPFPQFKERTLIDTGSRQLYVVNKRSIDEATDDLSETTGFSVEGRSFGRSAIGYTGAEERSEVWFLHLPAVHMGNTTLTGMHTITTQGGSHLGAPLLSYGAMTFVPKGKRMRFQPYCGTDTCHVDNSQTEIAFIPDGNRTIVGLVWDGGEPYRCGFREGDVLQTIDGRPVRSFRQFAAWGFERGREYRFGVIGSDGTQREIRWVRLKE